MQTQLPVVFSPKIKIFLDGADRAQILEWVPNPLVQGFTTNPSLMAKAKVTNYKEYCVGLLPELKGKPISYEVFADEFLDMESQAYEIASWEKPGSSIFVKIPVVNTKGESAIPLIRTLTQKKIKLNVTAVYTATQVYEIAQALKGGAPSIVSVFAGRIADTGVDPAPMVIAAADICQNAGSQIELLWASTREAYNIVQAEKLGCKIITSPSDMIKKLSSGFGRSAWDLTLDTVKAFKKDSDTAGFKL